VAKVRGCRLPGPSLTRRTPVMRCVALAILLCLAATPALAATFTVTNTNDSGSGSLRECVAAVNGSPGPHRIVFNIPGAGVRTIHLLSHLGVINNTVAIDGTSMPGYNSANGPLLELDASSAGFGACTIQPSASHSSVRGVTFNGFANNAL